MQYRNPDDSSLEASLEDLTLCHDQDGLDSWIANTAENEILCHTIIQYLASYYSFGSHVARSAQSGKKPRR